jgi:protein-tyrosine phosphatase
MVPFTVLVVCLGNVCRSPVAERLLRARLQELIPPPVDVSVSSAGVRAWAGRPMDQHAATELLRLGGNPGGFVSAQLTVPMVEDCDLVLTATRELRSRVLEDAPRALRRTFTIREFAALVPDPDGVRRPLAQVAQAARRRSDGGTGDHDVPDPIGQSVQVHRDVADLLDLSCTAIARALAASLVEA